jgi:serine/threonine protein kinase/tetratricopeptide (TPR) repeat protein
MNQIDVEVTTNQTTGQEDQRLVQIAEEYRALLEAGQKPDRQLFFERYPDLAHALSDCFDGLEFVFTVAPDVRESSARRGSPDPAGSGSGSPDPANTLPAAVPLGDYKVIREIGRGGMGVVYEAEQMLLGRRVALKVLPFAATMDARQLQRFQNEARAAACLHHPHIVPVYAVGCERGVHFYAMQFIEGQSLAGVIGASKKESESRAKPQAAASTIRDLNSSTQLSTRGPAFFHAAARLGVQAAQALDHAHQVGVLHRDIKPANLMVDGRGNVWITDFGLAQIQGDVQLTMTGDLVGTLRYMSPEQALAKRVLVDHRTDIYSLGATLYELLTLQPVFPGGDRQELLRQIAFEEPLALRRHNKAIPAELETIVLKALEKNPADRYASAQELADDLERYGKDEPIKARRPSVARRVKGWARRHRVVVASLVAILTTALVLGGATFWSQQLQRTSIELAVTKDLEDADFWQTQERWDKMLQATQQAVVRLEGIGPGPLQMSVKKRHGEAVFIVRLEDARLKSLSLTEDGKRDFAQGNQAYERTFVDNGLDIQMATPEETARQIRSSGIRSYLVTALDYWAYLKERLPGDKGERLRAVARLADDNPWRQLLRDPGLSQDQKTLEKMATDKGTLAQQPADLLILFYLLQKAKSKNAGVGLLRRAQEQNPSDLWINLEFGNLLCKDSETSVEGLGFIRVALALQPQSPLIYGNLGYNLVKQKKWSEAETAYRKAIQLQPDYAQAFAVLGFLLDEQGKLSEAEQAHREAIKLKPNDAIAFNNLSANLRRQRKFSEAETAALKAIELKSDYANPYVTLGATLMEDKGRLPEAERAFRKAIELKTDVAEAYNQLAKILRDQQKWQEAVDVLRMAIKLEPDDPALHSNLGDVLGRQRKFPEAIEALGKALELKPDFGTAYFLLGRTLKAQGKFPDAEAAYGKAIELDMPDIHDAYNNLGVIYLNQKRWIEAEQALRKAIELKPDIYVFYHNLGVAFHDQQKYLKAVEFFRNINDSRFFNLNLYNAACAAALAGCGKGDAINLSEDEKARLRGQSLVWLRAHLDHWRVELEKDSEKFRAGIQKEMQRWQKDSDFDGVRGDALAKLPEAERQAWQALWDDVAALEKRAAEKP